jgi:short-subunit dehydrogenase involved in D-alanine esterification of teichoic acids
MYKGKRGIWLYKNGKSKFKNINIVVNNGNYSGTYDLTNQDLIIVPNKNIKNNMSIIIRNDFLTND